MTPESHVAIDGKAVRASAKKSAGGRVPYIVSAFLVGNGISIGQKIVGDKTNEITEIPKLLDVLDIKDCFVTIDAIGTQTKIMEKIIEKGGHFCLQLKNNHKEPFDAVKLFFDDLEQNVPRVFNSMDCYVKKIKDHGRCESREYRVLTDEKDIQVLLGDKWPYVKCIGMASLTRRAGEEVSHEVHFHVLDTAVSAEKYAKLVRGHWEIENNLHWVLDMHFREDASTANTDHAIENLALLRKIAFNFANLDDSMKGKSIKKKMIDYMINLDLFNRLIYEIVQNRT